MVDSRDIKDLHPTLQRAAEELIRRTAAKGIEIIITSTYRDSEKQNALYAQGRTMAGNIVTNVKGGYSYHNHRLAFDFVPIVNGKADYNNTALFNTVGRIGQEMGLEWGGSWTGFVDMPHFQFTNGLKCSELINGAKMPDIRLPWEGGTSESTPNIRPATYETPVINQEHYNSTLVYNRTGLIDYTEALPVDSGYKFNGIPQVSMHYPMVEVEIITEKENLVMRGEITDNIDTSELVSDCLSIVTKRDTGTDCPTFSIILVYKDKWFYEIGANDMVIIRMCRKPEELTPVMFGLIDDIRKTVTFGNGKPRRSISITGRGFGKGLITFEIGAVKEINMYSGDLAYLGWMGDSVEIGNIASAPAARAIGELVENYVKVYIDYNFGQGKTYNTYMRYKPTERLNESLYDASILNDYQGSIWNLFKELQNAPFNEMFWEIEDGLPTLIVRPTPFNPADWAALPIITLEDTEIIEDNVGRSDLETYTIFSVACRSFMNVIDQVGTLGSMPLWYRPYYDKYGVKRLNVSSLYAAFAGTEDKENMGDMVNEYTEDLFNWNIKNNSMFNGTILAMGNTKFKLGCRLYHKSENMDYYIESVTHNFSIYESFTTQLAVTRGIRIGERFTPPFDCGEELNSMEMLRKGEAYYGVYGPSSGQGTADTAYRTDDTVPGETPSGNWSSPFIGKNWRSAISSPFGQRTNPISGKTEFHDGADIAYPSGTSINAVKSGVVTAVNAKSGYGNSVEIDHGNGSNSFYGHCTAVFVSKGQQVNAGEVIASVGSTGYSTGPHLHLTIKESGKLKDPASYLP